MRRRPHGFTLVELVVSAAILMLMLLVIVQMTNHTAATWKRGNDRAEKFQEARKAFETMTARISSATLNTYWDYAYDPNAANKVSQGGTTTSQSAVATDYVRQSDLRFRVLQMNPQKLGAGAIHRPSLGVFFQSPFGLVNDNANLGVLDSLLNSWGYFVEVGPTNTRLPRFLAQDFPPRYRARLMEFAQPAEQFTLYKQLAEQLAKSPGSSIVPQRDPPTKNGKVDASDDDWFMNAINSDNRPVRVLAENIIALVLLPKLSPADEAARKADPNVPSDKISLSPVYTYHSKQTSNYDTPPTANDVLQHPEVYGAINPKNQLPPVIQVAMFAIDELSAAKLEREQGQTLGLATMLRWPIGAGPSRLNLFQTAANLESSPAKPDGGDLATMEQLLIQRHVNYRLFTSNISLKGAKWSSTATK